MTQMGPDEARLLFPSASIWAICGFFAFRFEPGKAYRAAYHPPVPIPRIVIVGRPNVGKSPLLNMMAGEKVSIVDPTPGTTRDRVAAVVQLKSPDGPPSRPIEVIDTGGYGVYTAEGQRYDDIGKDLASLTPEIEAQIAAAIRSADLILFAVDAQAGLTPHDQDIARWLREGRLPGEAKL